MNNPTQYEINEAANLLNQWLQDETDYSQQILFDLPKSVYATLLELSAEDIKTILGQIIEKRGDRQ